jgi:hypothetical protein
MDNGSLAEVVSDVRRDEFGERTIAFVIGLFEFIGAITVVRIDYHWNRTVGQTSEGEDKARERERAKLRSLSPSKRRLSAIRADSDVLMTRVVLVTRLVFSAYKEESAL